MACFMASLRHLLNPITETVTDVADVFHDSVTTVAETDHKRRSDVSHGTFTKVAETDNNRRN